MFRRQETVPPELAFLDGGEWRELSRVVDKAAKRLGGRRDGSVVLLPRDQRINLSNLARTCHQLPKGSWPAEVDRFLTAVSGIAEDLVEMIRADPAAARRQLRVRPYVEGAFEGVPIPVVTRPLAGELLDVLCLDFPDRVAMVNQEMAEALGAPEDELLALGLANVRAEGPLPLIEQLDVEDDVPLHVFAGDSFYAATWGRWPDLLVPGLGEYGALVVTPFRHQVVVHALRTGKGAAVAPGPLLQLASLGFSDGVGPVSPQLFWWRDGRLTHLPGGVTDEGISFSPSEDYVRMLETLFGTG